MHTNKTDPAIIAIGHVYMSIETRADKSVVNWMWWVVMCLYDAIVRKFAGSIEPFHWRQSNTHAHTEIIDARLSFNLLHSDCFADFMDKIRLILRTRIRSCTFMVFFLIVHVTLHKDSIFFPFRALTNSFHSHLTTKRSGLMTTRNEWHNDWKLCASNKKHLYYHKTIKGGRVWSETHAHVTFTQMNAHTPTGWS